MSSPKHKLMRSRAKKFKFPDVERASDAPSAPQISQSLPSGFNILAGKFTSPANQDSNLMRGLSPKCQGLHNFLETAYSMSNSTSGVCKVCMILESLCAENMTVSCLMEKACEGTIQKSKKSKKSKKSNKEQEGARRARRSKKSKKEQDDKDEHEEHEEQEEHIRNKMCIFSTSCTAPEGTGRSALQADEQADQSLDESLTGKDCGD